MIPSDIFPWESHRSLAEVEETRRLLAEFDIPRPWHRKREARLEALLARAAEPLPQGPPEIVA